MVGKLGRSTSSQISPMQRLVCIHCRGTSLNRIRPARFIFHPPLLPISNVSAAAVRSFRQPCFTFRKGMFPWASRSLVRYTARPRFLLALLAMAGVPLTVQDFGGDGEDIEESALDQSVLDTSEHELEEFPYGVIEGQSIFFKNLKIAFIRYIYEPIATGLRFIQLVAIFLPVFATIPFIFVGSRNPDHDNERTGTLWWYSFLVKQMERAGPTFIKVVHNCLRADCSLDNGRLLEQIYSLRNCVVIWRNSTPTSKPMAFQRLR